MSAAPNETASAAKAVVYPRPWVSPRLAELPKLSQLTLASAIGGGGGTGSGGSTVFGLLLAAGLLLGASACAGDRGSESVGSRAPTLTRAVTCLALVAERTVSCDGGPQGAVSNKEIIGGAGTFVALRSSDVDYDGADEFTFNVTVQNLGAQSIGTIDGITWSGIDVFFESMPVATGGVGVIGVPDPSGTATFTSASVPYYHYDTFLEPGEESTPVSWTLSIPPAVTSFAFTVMVSADVPDVGGVLLWERVRPTTAQFGSMLDIAANSATDAMAVGPAGLVMQKTAAGWKTLPRQLTDNWVGVEAVGNGEYVGATSNGGVYLYARGTWRLLHQVAFAISTLTASSSEHIMVGGVGRLAWWGSNGTIVDHVVGTGGVPLVASAWHGLGNEFITGSSAGFMFRGNFLAGPLGLTGNLSFGFTAMAATSTSNPLVARGLGGSAYLTDIVSTFDYVAGATDSTIDAVTYGAGGVGAFFWRATRNNTTGNTRLSSYNAGWTSRATVTGTVRQIIDDKNGGIYLLTSAGIKRWNGSAVVDEYVPFSAGGYSLYSVWGNDTTAIVSTTQGVYQLKDGVWTWRDLGNGVVGYWAVGGTGPDDQWAGWTAGLTHWDGVNWTVVPELTGVNVAGVYAVPGATTLIEGKNIWMDLGGGWSQRTDAAILTANDSIRAVWGSSATDIWVVTKGSRVLRFNGTNWTYDVGSAFGADGRKITGSGTADVWVAHKDSLRHWNGGAWSGDLAPPGCGFIYHAVSTAPDHLLFTCASDGTVRFRTPTSTGTIFMPGGEVPWHMAGTVGGNIWVLGGDNFVYRGRR